MRISDDRYHRERVRMELALRFLRHQARTQTIRAWTGLSDDRIRKLYRSYYGPLRTDLPRHRGKSPHQVSYFTRSARLQQETAAIASRLWVLGALQAEAGVDPSGMEAMLERGTLLCQAFEAHRIACPGGQISFEHAVFLAGVLARGERLRIGWCGLCGGLLVQEAFALRARRCLFCTE
ncbi:MAG: hypothetical protein JOZ67_01865 [Gammaproteobacteria bacterium]|nr:hypothetical protein [Gammaproteobacteria bacterium]MBV9697737.1 hypothetical protein [Gammaproteobacteria bacterium]